MEEENAKLKKLVADLSLDKAMLQDVVRRKLESPRASVNWSMTCNGGLAQVKARRVG